MGQVIVIGGGPCGLSVAASLQERGIACLVLEKGGIVNSIAAFPANMRLYSTSDRLEIGGVPFLSEEERPTRNEVMRYYRLLTARLGIAIRTFHRVTDVVRTGGGFEVRAADQHGRDVSFEADEVVIATGTYDQPRLIEAPGEQLPKVRHYYTEGHSYAGMRVLVVGGKNSAVEAAIDLYRNGADVTLVHRGDTVLKGIKPTLMLDIRNMIEKQRIRFYPQSHVLRIEEDYVRLLTEEGEVEVPNDFVFSLIGYQPDIALLRRLDIGIDEETKSPRFDPFTYETDAPGVYVAGVVTAGITNTVFIDDGRLHGPAIAEAIAARRQAAGLVRSGGSGTIA
ncbi:YpdA family putative bacillithiol disulfide reductase [Paenibacillus hodogayensis]|uniref:YpdA family putative bacillithiol disulfide reductase n=1 Tax=Paenibacillus hodogayensis TaxID=279208 RepID=A0ABV5W3M1_9BACL